VDKTQKYTTRWKSGTTCVCVALDTTTGSIDYAKEPLQHWIAFEDGNCKSKPLGNISGKCINTNTQFSASSIGSAMIWLPGLCDLEDDFKDIVADVGKLIAEL
jgi:hypothetical protein